MKLGDFFKSAPHARPVNPKPVTFTAVCKDLDTLPGGTPNHTKKQVAAKIDACFVFVGVDGMAQARLDARKVLREQQPSFDPKTKMPLPPMPLDDTDFGSEVQNQLLVRALREYDDKEHLAGAPLFPEVANVRELIEQSEANRLWRLYFDYVAEEHPEALDDATFRKTEG